MQTLRELIEMGFAPMLAIVIIVVLTLWGTLCTLVVFTYHQFVKDRANRDSLRQEQLADIDERLEASERKHDECDRDRAKLHGDVNNLQYRIGRFESCPRAGCPMRLP